MRVSQKVLMSDGIMSSGTILARSVSDALLLHQLATAAAATLGYKHGPLSVICEEAPRLEHFEQVRVLLALAALMVCTFRMHSTVGYLSFHPMAQCASMRSKARLTVRQSFLRTLTSPKHNLFSMGPELRYPPVT